MTGVQVKFFRASCGARIAYATVGSGPPVVLLPPDVQVLADLVDHLRLRRLALLGQSHGAPMAATYAADHPRRVSHLVLYGMTRFREEIDERWAALRALLLADWQVGSLAMASVMLAARPVRRSPRSLDCGGAVSARR